MKQIIVVDDFMGSGKTSFAIQYMNEHPDLSYIFCTPFLDEIKRIKDDCPTLNFREPTFYHGRKIDDFNSLLMEGKNIAVTHQTFINATDETVEFIRNSDYILFMDETVNTLLEYNDVCNEGMTVRRDDIRLLIRKNVIEVDAYGNVEWTDESYQESHYSEIERLAKNHTLLCLDETLLLWQFPAYIFELFRRVYVLTYMFDGSLLRPYFQYHGLGYTKKSVQRVDGHYELIDYRIDKEMLSGYKDLIYIYDNLKANDYKGSSLSKSWYRREGKAEEGEDSGLKKLKKHLQTFFKSIPPFMKSRPKAEHKLWTAFNEFESDLRGDGYCKSRRMTPEERSLPVSEREKVEKKIACFLPCNARATNDFKDRDVLAYCVNLYINRFTRRYFQKKNDRDGTKLYVNEDLFSLQNMLQWIFRGSIREKKPVYLYIPSARMRNLLMKWLNGEIGMGDTS